MWNVMMLMSQLNLTQKKVTSYLHVVKILLNKSTGTVMGDFDNDDRDDEVAVNHLLQYMLASLAVHSPAVGAAVAAFPSSLYFMKKLFRIGTDEVQKYIIHRKCESPYQLDECFEYNLLRKIPKKCSHIAFPDHPHASRRIQYGHKLVKEVITKKGKSIVH